MPEATKDIDKDLSMEEARDNLKQSKLLSLFLSTDAKDTKKEKQSKATTKVIVRRLPPCYTKQSFFSDFQLPTFDSAYFVRGDLSLGPHSYSRAYVNFVNQKDVFQFRDKYDDFMVQDEQGREYHAVVEFAPSQRISRHLKKKSQKSGNLDEDAKYIEFLNRLEQEKNNPGSTSTYFHETDSCSRDTQKEITITPLIEFMRMKKQRKIDVRNETRQKKREFEKERRRREDDVRKNVNEDVVTEESKKKWEGKPKKDGKKDKEENANETKKEITKTYYSKKESNYERPTSRIQYRKQDTRIITSSSYAGSNKSNRGVLNSNTSSSEPKSKFRYSEQRNRNIKPDEKKQKADESKKNSDDPPRCKSLETENNENENKDDLAAMKRSVSLEDDQAKKNSNNNNSRKEDCGNLNSGDKRDPRTSRRIPNKERPTMEIYRPGMGRFSKQRLDPKSEKTASDQKEDREKIEEL